MRQLILLLVAVIGLSLGSFAQRDYSNPSSKAIKNYEKALESYRLRYMESAEELLKKAIDKDPEFIESHILLSDIYIETGKDSLAILELKEAIRINPEFYPLNFFFLGMLQLQNADYQNGKSTFETFLKYGPHSADIMRDAELAHKSCTFALKALRNPVPFKPRNLGAGVNTELPEYFPALTADGNTLFYTRRLNDERNMTGYNEDFYVSHRVGGEWQQGRNVGGPINTLNNEGAPTIGPDGRLVIFTACPTVDGYGRGRNGYGSCDLFATQRQGASWTPPRNIGKPVNTGRWESQPSWSADGKTLYFVRGKFTGQGIKEQDIWMAQLNDQGEWDAPKRLPMHINTPGREVSVQIHPDGKTLYFASDGHPGMGGLDLYVTRMDDNGEWGQPVNLGYPINTSADENSLLVSAKGDIALFASDREGGKGELDLYEFDLPKQHRPDVVTYMRGKVYDKTSDRAIAARFQLVDRATNEVVVQARADQKTGQYLVCLPTGRDYALNVQQNGYLFWSETFTLTESTDPEKPFEKNVPLTPIKVGEPVVLKNVFFDTDKYDLKPQSRAELDKLADWLKKNSTLKIELGGHTDNVGDDSSNQELSENRAKAVFEYLQTAGIAAERLSYKGYGETKPRETNDTAEGRALNRRTEFLVVGK